MDITSDIIGSLDSPEERRARVQQAYDDGYQDGRLDIEREMEQQIATLKSTVAELALSNASLRDQVDYWRNLTNIANADVKRLRELLALQIEQSDEAVDEAYENGWNDGVEAEALSLGCE